MGRRGDGVGRRVVPEDFLTGMAATVQTSRWDGSWYRRVSDVPVSLTLPARVANLAWVADGYTPGVTAVVFGWGCSRR